MPSVARRFDQSVGSMLDCGSAPAPPAQRQWSCEGGTSLKDSSDSKCHSVYDSGCMDSGFLSGTNLSSSENYVSEEIRSRNFSDTESELPAKSVDGDSKSYARLDSGLDVGLNEQFSSLSLKSINDLNEPTSKTQDVSTRISNISPVPTSHSTTVPSKTAPWEKYFQHNNFGDTPLHEAVITGFIEAVSALIRIAPVPDLLDIRNDAGQTALHVAVLTKQWMLVRQLVVGGAAIAVRDRYGNTALHLASQVGDVDCLKALVTPVTQQELVRAGLHGRPEPAAANHPLCLEERNYDGMMCVHLAAVEGHVDMLRNLVYCGANINAREAKSGRTVLHLAIELQLTGVLHFLLEEVLGALQLDVVTYAGLTAYQLAACIDTSLADNLALRGAQRRAFPEEDSSSDEDDEEEMYRNFPSKYFQELKFNGGPINASA